MPRLTPLGLGYPLGLRREPRAEISPERSRVESVEAAPEHCAANTSGAPNLNRRTLTLIECSSAMCRGKLTPSDPEGDARGPPGERSERRSPGPTISRARSGYALDPFRRLSQRSSISRSRANISRPLWVGQAAYPKPTPLERSQLHTRPGERVGTCRSRCVRRAGWLRRIDLIASDESGAHTASGPLAPLRRERGAHDEQERRSHSCSQPRPGRWMARQS